MEMIPRKDGLLGWCTLNGTDGHTAGRSLLAALWSHCANAPMPSIAVTPRGKPYFQGNPMYFSVSHTPQHAFCMLSCRPVGLDAEEMDRRVPPKLAEKILSPSEYARYRESENPNADLLRLWVLKEAAAKLSGEGLRGYPNGTDYRSDDPSVEEIDGCYVAVLTLEEI